jgi:amino acid adenylation domain-containing protein
MSQDDATFDNHIAIVGMAGRFPQAGNLDRFWENLRDGVESISFFSEQELLATGVSPATLSDPRYVRAAGVLADVDLFDANFFGFSAREAALLDPQQRLFLECSWQALEEAGYDARRIAGPVGVYAGASVNSYYFFYLFSPRDLLNAPGSGQAFLGGDKDFLATRVSYELGLRGPSLSVQTACSTSLVAVHLACQSLLNGECDMALAGGVSVRIPQKVGYFHQSGSILSPDGHCRAFDAEAAGTVSGSGVGVVVLKRLEDALADGDPVRAVIRGTAVNNDGALRVGFSAPSVEGQAAAISEALALAGVQPESLGYVEAHGSGTPLGDPIEMAALTRALRSAGVGRRGFCAVGSVKTNIGHLDAAAGVAGLIKTALSLEQGEIPPSLNFRAPNPEIDFAGSPFYVNTQLREWPRDGAPRRGGVSSFGLGGTNAHVVLEEAPKPEPSGPSRPWQVLVLSAATPTALDAATDNLAAHLRAHPEQPLPDIAWTLQAGRRVFAHRRAQICANAEEAARLLEARDFLEGAGERTDREAAFLLPGLGDHYPGMGRGLYESEPVFREEVDRCCRLLEPHLGVDLRETMFAGGEEAGSGIDLRAMLGRSGSGASALDNIALAQPALFVIEMATARLFQKWGIAPAALLGYSLGEYAAACLAGVLSLEDALRVVALRARLIEGLPAGAMTAVPLPEAELLPLLGEELSLSAVNGPELCVVGGPVEAVARFEESLAGREIPCRRLRTSHAFHSKMMRPIAEEFGRLMTGVELKAPEIPYVSNVTGNWVTAAETTDPAFWVRHLLEPVRFADGLARLADAPSRVFLEAGPGQSLASLALQLIEEGGRTAVPTLRSEWERRPDQAYALGALARLWLAGVPVDWTGFAREERRHRVRLPTYPFERRRYWIEETREPEAALETPEISTTVHSRPGLATPYVAPSTPLESELAGIWEELLGVKPIGVRDSFFDLGGHSLLATQLLARLSARFGVEVPLAALFEEPTLAGLAPRIVGKDRVVEAVAASHRELAPMSFAQQRLWFIDRLSPGISAYNNPVAVRLRGAIDRAALEAALAEIVRRHDILRTTFGLVDGEPSQRIHPFDPAAVPGIEDLDLRPLPEAEREAEARRLLWQVVERPFDLAHGPVLRHALARLGEEEHLFVTVMHHILWDEWSQGIYIGELAALYDAFRDGKPSPLPPLPMQYADWAAWQRETLRGETLERHLAYWRERLEGAPRLLALPTDRPRPAVQTFRGATRTLALPEDLHQALTVLSQRHGTTLFMTLMAAFQAVLGRWSGQEDLIVSTGTGGRNRVEAERLIGCFINILLLRGDLSGGPSFAELLARTRAATLGAFEHGDLPFELIVEALRVERDPSVSPLAQVMLVFLNVPSTSIELPGLTVDGVRIDREAAQFDIVFYMGEQAGRLGGHLEYNRDLFDAGTIDRLLGHFHNLLARATAEPEKSLDEIPLLSGAEREQAVLAWNRTEVDFPDAGLHELFERRAAGAPEAPGVLFEEREVTYGEIEDRAGRLAGYLRRLGVARGDVVGVSLERSPEVAVALLAILKAGGAYLPLDPEYPAERIAYMVESTRARVLVAQASLEERFSGQGARTVVLDALPELPEDSTRVPVSPDDLLYVIFTSGSTGRPKGCMLDHRGRVSNFCDFNRRFEIGPGDRVLGVSSLSFDMSAYDVLGTLAGGGALVFPHPREALKPAAWAALMARHRVSIWHSVPALLEMLIEYLEERPEQAAEALAGLRVVLLGGDWIPVALPDRLRALAPQARVVSLGGATEVSMDSTIYEIGGVDPAWKSIPYGRPMWNQRAYVNSVAPEPAPVGVSGELLLGGVGVGAGYFGRPDLTAERFVPDPWSPVPGARAYRTGDLARYGPDGLLELLGRLDHQVKVRGFRIELGEILAGLRSHPSVAEAVVTARDERGTKRLVAYVVSSGDLDLEELKSFLRERLPAYMVPAAFVVLPALPLTPNGKLDRKALPAPERAATSGAPAVEFVAPRTAIEKVVAGIWEEVLGRAPVGARDDFFDLGGHSLAATRVVTHLEEAFPLEVPLRLFFEAPTVAGLAEGLSALAASAGVDLEGIAEVLAEVRAMDEGEVRALLAEGAQP